MYRYLFKLKCPVTVGLNNFLRKTLKCHGYGNFGSGPDLHERNQWSHMQQDDRVSIEGILAI